MTQAAAAVKNAIKFEAKKDGLQQRQGGDWVLRLTLAAIDMDQRITQAPMGTRYQVVIVEINDDETPVDHHAMERDKWRDLGPVRQAGIRCKDPIFWAYLTEEMQTPVRTEEEAAVAVRFICQVTSRSDLGKPGFGIARTNWYDLDSTFQAWKARENA
jgi:hypothetical protein